MEKRTIGERAFEDYIASRSLPQPERIKKEKGRRTADYVAVLEDARKHAIEVKDLIDDAPVRSGFFTFDEVAPVRSKIEKARGQFSDHRGDPCVLVLFNVNAFVFLDEPISMFGAMHGDITLAFPWSPSKGLDRSGGQIRFGRDGVLSPPFTASPKNTKFSAIANLRSVAIGTKRLAGYLNAFPGDTYFSHLRDDVPFDPNERALGVMVYENRHARNPLSPDVFRGPYDERFVLTDEGTIERTFVGERVLEVEAVDALLKASGPERAKEIMAKRGPPRTGRDLASGEEAHAIAFSGGHWACAFSGRMIRKESKGDQTICYLGPGTKARHPARPFLASDVFRWQHDADEESLRRNRARIRSSE